MNNGIITTEVLCFNDEESTRRYYAYVVETTWQHNKQGGGMRQYTRIFTGDLKQRSLIEENAYSSIHNVRDYLATKDLGLDCPVGSWRQARQIHDDVVMCLMG